MEQTFIGQVTVKAVLKYKDSFVIVKEQGSDHWTLSGGRLNIGETAEECLLREIKEELSIAAKVENIISVNAHHANKSGKFSKLFIFYVATIPPKEAIHIAAEIVDIAFISKKGDLERYPMPDNQKSVLEKFLGSI